MKLEIEYISLGEIKDYPNNAKLHPLSQIEKIKKSIKEFGNNDPIAIDENNEIIEGHGRKKALSELYGIEYKAPIIRLIGLSEPQKKAYRIAHNKTQESGFDLEFLKTELKWLKEQNYNLETTGLKETEIIKLIDNEIQEKPINTHKLKYKTSNGEIWKLGNHKLLVGSSTDEQLVSNLFEDKKARMVFTDPPYGVSYSGTNNPNGKEWEVIKGDNLRGEELYNLILNASKIMHKFTIDNPAIYMFYASINHTQFEKALTDAKFRIKQQLIWDKHHILGHSDYHWNHEPIFYAVKDKNCEWFGQRDQKTLFSTEREREREDPNKLTKDQLVKLLAEIYENSTIWKIKRDNTTDYIHPTQKPYQIAQKAILNNSKQGEIIYEPFAGSGSTLIACEVTKRICYAVELDEKYASLILERYENLTGIKPELVNN